jgi:ribonuclease P protein component
MLKKTFRLSNSKDIYVTSLRGRSFFSPYFVIKFVASPAALPLPRFTVIVSTKVSKRAVERNRIKRVLREAIRGDLSAFRPGDYVIIVKARAAKRLPAEIRQELDRLMASVRLKKS